MLSNILFILLFITLNHKGIMVLGLDEKDVNDYSYLRRGVVSWYLSCKFPLHFTNLWQTDSFSALPKMLRHRKWSLRLKAPGSASGSLVRPLWPLCKPSCKQCAKRSVPSTNWSNFLSIFCRHHFNFETKIRFLCKELYFGLMKNSLLCECVSCSNDATEGKSPLY